MHGGLLNASEFGDSENYHLSLNAEEEKLAPLLQGTGEGVSITHIAGTIETDEKARLKKLLFRATKGKAATYFQELPIDEQRIVNQGQPIK